MVDGILANQDANGDGYVNYFEFQAAQKRRTGAAAADPKKQSALEILGRLTDNFTFINFPIYHFHEKKCAI